VTDLLLGIDDIPAIADDKCAICLEYLTVENFSDWFIFVKHDGQVYKVPCCNPCLEERYKGGEKCDNPPPNKAST
jgi:hypothetical protein